jgi:hypothetical protein
MSNTLRENISHLYIFELDDTTKKSLRKINKNVYNSSRKRQNIIFHS